MSGAERDPREGVLEEAGGGRWRMRFERRLSHSPEKVWRALTDEEHLSAWFPTTIEGELRAGAPLRFRFRGADLLPTAGQVIECDPPRVLEFTWGFGEEDITEPERTRFEIVAVDGGCVLVFTTTYDQVGKSSRDAAGWHVCFDLLERHLSGEAPPPPAERPWKQLEERYAARFGAAASTLGPPPGLEHR